MRLKNGQYSLLGRAFASQSSFAKPARLTIDNDRFSLGPHPDQPRAKYSTPETPPSSKAHISGHNPNGHNPNGHNPSGHNPSGHDPSGHDPSEADQFDHYLTCHGNIETLRLDPALGSLARKIHMPNGILFETDDHDSVSNIEHRSFWSWLHQTEKVGWHLVPFAILTPIIAFAFYRMMIPVIISAAMFMTPNAMVHTIDDNTMKALDFKLAKETTISAERQENLQTTFNDLSQSALARSAFEGSTKSKRIPKYRLLFRDTPLIGPNAFALPGGTIVLTDDLVEMFPNSDQDYVLAAVLAHEIGHVEYEHSLRQLYRALGIAVMVGFIAGDAGPILDEVILEGSALLSLSFSRAHELESDNYSFDLLTQTGRRADGLITFFDTLEAELPLAQNGEWLQSHPLSNNRVQNIKDKLAAQSGS